METEDRRAAKAQLVTHMLQGQPWDAAAAAAGLHVSRSTAYRLLQRVRTQGEAALADGRHGHPTKLRAPLHHWLEEFWRERPQATCRKAQTALEARFGVEVSQSHLSRVRAALGLTPVPEAREKKQAPSQPVEPTWQEGAGSLLLLAAAHKTGLLEALECAMPVAQAMPSSRLAHSTSASRRWLLLTLLFLGAVGLRRIWDLRGYTATALALLSGRKRAYSYRHVERFLSEVAQAGGAEPLTDALAAWTTRLWKPATADGESPVPVYYLDGHRKPVYSDCLLPRGVIGRTGKILGCRTLLLLHDAQGHPLLATTHRGDLHLTLGTPSLLTRYETATSQMSLRRLVIDREGMAAEFLSTLAAEERWVVTILRDSAVSRAGVLYRGGALSSSGARSGWAGHPRGASGSLQPGFARAAWAVAFPRRRPYSGLARSGARSARRRGPPSLPLSSQRCARACLVDGELGTNANSQHAHRTQTDPHCHDGWRC
jgi:transposase